MKSKEWKLPYILVFSSAMNRENLSEFIHFISNHCYISSTMKSQVQAHCFVNVSMEMIEGST
jgi:hypothetical protein